MNSWKGWWCDSVGWASAPAHCWCRCNSPCDKSFFSSTFSADSCDVHTTSVCNHTRTPSSSEKQVYLHYEKRIAEEEKLVRYSSQCSSSCQCDLLGTGACWPYTMEAIFCLGRRDSLLVLMPDSQSKGCEFEFRQERQKNFLLHSRLCVLTLIWCPFHPHVTSVACKRPRLFCQKCKWQVIP